MHASACPAQVSAFANTLRAIDASSQGAALRVWRPAVPGHCGCQQHQNGRPTQSMAKAIALQRQCQWYMGYTSLSGLNSQAARILCPGGWELLDVWEASLMRVDSHIGWTHNSPEMARLMALPVGVSHSASEKFIRQHPDHMDCLHSCTSSGPSAHWARLLYALATHRKRPDGSL